MTQPLLEGEEREGGVRGRRGGRGSEREGERRDREGGEIRKRNER